MPTVEQVRRHTAARRRMAEAVGSSVALVRIVREDLEKVEAMESDGWRLRQAGVRLLEAVALMREHVERG